MKPWIKAAALTLLALLTPACNWLGYPQLDVLTGTWKLRVSHNSDGGERGVCVYRAATNTSAAYLGCFVRQSALQDGCIWDADVKAWCSATPTLMYGQPFPLALSVVNY